MRNERTDLMSERELDEFLAMPRAPIASDDLTARILADHGQVTQKSGAARGAAGQMGPVAALGGLIEGVFDFFVRRPFVPAGALGALAVLGFAIGISTAASTSSTGQLTMIAFSSDDPLDYADAAIETIFSSEDEGDLWVVN